MYGDGINEIRRPLPGIMYKAPGWKPGDLVRARYGWHLEGVVGVFIRIDRVTDGRGTTNVVWFDTIGEGGKLLCACDWLLTDCTFEDITEGKIEVVSHKTCLLRADYKRNLDMFVWCYARDKSGAADDYMAKAMANLTELKRIGDRYGEPGAYTPKG